MTNSGAQPHARTRDPKSIAQRRRRELDNNNAQVTLAKAKSRARKGWMDSESWYFLARAALDKGGTVIAPGVVHWNASGRCENPQFVERKALVTDLYGRVEARENGTRTRFLDMEVPCRRCRNCLWRKALHWTHRSIAECEVSPRTWLVTLTFNAHMRALIKMRAEAVAGEDWGALSQEQRTARLGDQANKFVTLWMKRVRKHTGPGVRYVSVIEKHKDGTPHGHLLVHEARDGQVRHRTLTREWTYGFSNAKLVEDGPAAARYVAKYLAKSPITRVRASVGYGQTPGLRTA